MSRVASAKQNLENTKLRGSLGKCKTPLTVNWLVSEEAYEQRRYLFLYLLKFHKIHFSWGTHWIFQKDREAKK